MSAALYGATVTRARVATSLVFLGNGLGIGAWAACIPSIKHGLRLSDGVLGLALLCFAAGAIVAMPTSGWLSARLGGVRVTAGAALSFAAALCLPGLAPDVAVLVVTALLLGACNGLLDVAMNAHATTVEEAAGRPIMSSFHAVFSLGGLLGAVVAGGLLGAGFPAAATLALISVCVVVLDGLALRPVGLAVHLSDRSAPVAHDPSGGVGLRWPTAALLGLGALAFLTMMAEGAMADWSAVFLSSAAGSSPTGAAAGYAAFSLAMVAGRLTGDATVRRLGRRLVLRWGGLLAACGFALAVASATPGPAHVGMALVGLGLANLVPVLFSAAARSGGTSASIGVAMAATVGYAGFLLGPPLIGLAAEVVGLRLALCIPLAGALVIAMAPARQVDE